ncbi:single-strand selective monofunctional uracil DNA glycosylase-like [Penaeus monodon]|uniref:single-strand selective monofunctional uracil DNA glycosylase-like n=1 Tax=Penaeus monodon TaxID=6687 RepID=UPI0018A7C177|nr:single-strand selective monofunctional uracil DNA glycosylase-like [Penaeus monodon]
MPPKSKRQKTQHSACGKNEQTNSTVDTNSSADCVAPILSKYFPAPSISPQDIPAKFLEIEARQTDRLLSLDYGEGISYVYNPLDYASEIHADFVSKFCQGTKKVLLMGMNPGPWGMGQDWDFERCFHLACKICKGVARSDGGVKRPEREHPKRPIQGLECTKSEVSGDRLWSLLKELSGSPDVLFKFLFLHNYCPLFFLKESAKNVTPPELKAFAKAGITNIEISLLMHPSPVNPAANKGWREIAIKQLTESKVIEYLSQKFKCHLQDDYAVYIYNNGQ